MERAVDIMHSQQVEVNGYRRIGVEACHRDLLGSDFLKYKMVGG